MPRFIRGIHFATRAVPDVKDLSRPTVDPPDKPGDDAEDDRGRRGPMLPHLPKIYRSAAQKSRIHSPPSR